MSRIWSLLQWICRFNFGHFEKEEFKKFIRLGCVFALIIGVYWALRPLKDAIFIQLVGKLQLPYAKTVSVITLLPLVMSYTKLLEKTSREKMLLLLPLFYGIMTWFFTIFIFRFQSKALLLSSTHTYLTYILGYGWYIFVESFGSLLVALFWAFASDTSEPTSAKKGFPLVVMIGQMGGVVAPYFIVGLPHRLGLQTDAISMFILGTCTLLIIPLILYFFKVTPQHMLASFHGERTIKQEKQPGYLEGLKLILKHKYLIAIFLVNFIYEIIITIFDFNFKIEAASTYVGVALSHYLSLYASTVNIVALACLLLGISNVTRLGIVVALASMPIILALALTGFISLHSLKFLFILMVTSKAIHYALNGPALKQLYIPTSSDVRFKAQAWIETFGSRASKEVGSCFNMLLAPLQNNFGTLIGRGYYTFLSGCLGFPLLLIWFGIAIFLGKTYSKAVADKKIIC